MARPRPLVDKPPRSAAARLALAERLFRDFCALTPFKRPRPYARSFDSFAAYDRWKRGQRNPWY